MISVFEPDEFAQYPHVTRTLEFHGNTLRQKVWHFVAYQHYYYGFPFYAYSTITLLIPKLILGLGNTQLNMLVLRQFVSVLPMILSVWLLVYIQTKFQYFWRSIALFIFLLFIPVVVKNNLWWHPDSLAILFSILVIYFLARDDLKFGNDFLLASVAVGLSVGTKMLGWFFFLTIPTYLFWGLLSKKINWKELVKKSIIFLFIMFLTILVSNPALIHPDERMRYFLIQKSQASAMGFGWHVAYEKGPLSWFRIIDEYYGKWFLIILTTLSLIKGIWQKETRLVNVLILTWFLPMLIYILFFVAIKPVHLFMPIALPFFSSLINIYPANGQGDQRRVLKAFSITALLLILVQFVFNIIEDFDLINSHTRKEDQHPALLFYEEMESSLFSCLPEEMELTIYRDIRAYVPEGKNRDILMNWQPIDYTYLLDLSPDVLVFQQQKISDYTKDDLLSSAFEKDQMKKTIELYSDASKGEITDYQLIVADDFGKAYLREDLTGVLHCPGH